jgi:3-phenylpropionate/trans-cinnamate dioxygenase ferredoxin subunit
MTRIMACLEKDLPPGTMRNISLLGHTVLVVNVDGHYFAMDGLCSDQGGNLADGILSGFIIRCPLHGSEFDVCTGEVIKGPWNTARKIPGLRSYPVSVDQGCINVDINPEP